MFKTIVDSLKPQLLALKSKNASQISVNTLSESIWTNVYFDPAAFEGKVVLITDEAIVVKVKANSFAVLDKSLVTAVPSMGNKVKVTPYYRRQFNGQPVGEPHIEDTQYMDGEFYAINSCCLTDRRTHIPGPKVTDPDMLELIGFLQDQQLPDKYRHITHLMVDAGVKEVTLHEHDSSTDENRPHISFDAATSKFTGKIFIYYTPYPDCTFTVSFFDYEKQDIEVFEKMNAYELGLKLDEQLDGNSFKKINIDVI